MARSDQPQQPLSTRVGHRLAKVLAIDLDSANPPSSHPYQESARRDSVRAIALGPDEVYNEPDPTAIEYVRKFTPTVHSVGRFTRSLFPFTTWITRYNTQWLLGDLVAGITVGAVVVPQGMAYAKLAELPPEFGLYSSFVGVVVYWFFATSKDITIGPVAVMSTLVGNIVNKYPTDSMKEQVASALALICGCIVFVIGFLRLGFIVDFIPLTAIAAFMTGSALNIAVGQVPTLLGTSKLFNTRAPTYRVFIHCFRYLPETTLDAAMGITGLFALYLLRYIFGTFLVRRFPRHQKLWFFLNTLRTAFIILLYTMVSWLANMHHRKKPLFSILGKVPRGFKHMGAPTINSSIISSFSSELPAAVIVLLIEHIAISKSFGRVNNYTIRPSQELIAIGITNIIGPFFGAYPATGSFSRTAIKSKAGVRTPFAGVITGLVVLLAIYALTAVFFYIPNATLAAVIIHAVGDLITPPNTVYKFWRISPIEFFIFFAGVIVTIFSSIENGIYVTICVSLAVLLFRLAKARGHFLGKVRVHSIVGSSETTLLAPASIATSSSDVNLAALGDTKQSLPPPVTAILPSPNIVPSSPRESGGFSRSGFAAASTRNVFIPLDHRDGSNPTISVVAPYPGVFVYRFSEGFTYPNASHYTEDLVEYIFSKTRRGNLAAYGTVGDRPWNDPGPRDPVAEAEEMASRPTLKAIIFDMGSVNNVDITSVQNLLDVRNQLDRYASPHPVEWHFSAIGNRWTKRALASAGFGWSTDVGSGRKEGWKPVFSVAEVGLREDEEDPWEAEDKKDPEARVGLTEGKRRIVPIGSVDRPFFHVDLEGAVRSAIVSVSGT